MLSLHHDARAHQLHAVLQAISYRTAAFDKVRESLRFLLARIRFHVHLEPDLLEAVPHGRFALEAVRIKVSFQLHGLRLASVPQRSFGSSIRTLNPRDCVSTCKPSGNFFAVALNVVNMVNPLLSFSHIRVLQHLMAIRNAACLRGKESSGL